MGPEAVVAFNTSFLQNPIFLVSPNHNPISIGDLHSRKSRNSSGSLPCHALECHKEADSSSPSLLCQEGKEDKELDCSTKETDKKATPMAHRFEKDQDH
ncbi:hypothetical protein VNO78_05090 [Psophocarpus tetragonolobus]|uniref:Uncharacterized protein n=1 Tax=Psophocarpus tetragonolobus TaxID=3891 RepID=A0AAN9XQJ4_PSOTE